MNCHLINMFSMSICYIFQKKRIFYCGSWFEPEKNLN